MNQNYDIQGRLKMYFPIFFELLGDNKIDWKAVTKVFSKKVKGWIEKSDKTGQNIRVEASFFNVVTATIQGHQLAQSHLQFIKKLFEELIQELDERERKMIVPALYGMLTNIDRKFWNFVGELCVLNYIKKLTGYKLEEIEIPVTTNAVNGPKLDFQFCDAEKTVTHFFEIVNVHLTDTQEWSDEKINNLLNQKLQGKLNATGIRINDNFKLVPVFWGQFDELQRIHRFYQESQISFQNTLEPMCFASFGYGDGSHTYHFDSIDSIIKLFEYKRTGKWPGKSRRDF
jgi:hypothetical protein